MSIISAIIDALHPGDVIDLFFNDSSLVDINQTDAELSQTADMNQLCDERTQSAADRDVPLGKKVI